MHFFVSVPHQAKLRAFIVGRSFGHDRAKTAEIIFKKINTPSCIEVGILLFVSVAARKFSAGECARGTVEAKLESFAVHIVGQRFHIRKFLIRAQYAVGVTRTFPGVIDIDVQVAGIAHA